MIWASVLLLLGSDPASDSGPFRAALCHAHIQTFIADEMRDSDRVAGPSWFIQDWWAIRLPEEGAPGALTEAQSEELERSMPTRRDADPEAFHAERAACIDEAIEGGAVPGM